MTDTIRDRLLCWTTSGLAPHLYVKALSDMKEAADHIDAQAATIKALEKVLERIADLQVISASDMAAVALRNHRAALAAAKETT